jgi:Zn finger protein HypA/HybF involved in hydrogenase expression
MAEEPQLPPIPAIGEILDRKKKFVEKKHTVIKCKACKETISQEFKEGDFVFKELNGEECEKCHQKESLIIIEIYSEWIDPKKKKKTK